MWHWSQLFFFECHIVPQLANNVLFLIFERLIVVQIDLAGWHCNVTDAGDATLLSHTASVTCGILFFIYFSCITYPNATS